MHADNRGVDHLDSGIMYSGIMDSGKRFYDTLQTPGRRHLTNRL